jgi:hypothetical protein
VLARTNFNPSQFLPTIPFNTILFNERTRTNYD